MWEYRGLLELKGGTFVSTRGNKGEPGGNEGEINTKGKNDAKNMLGEEVLSK